MKLNKLCAILFAVLGVQTLSAQTDVTSTYLKNAGFDDESGWITSNVGSKTIIAAPEWKGASTGDTWFYGGAVGYGSSLTVNSVTPPATNPDGVAEGGALGLSAGWGCTVKYTQEVTLPAGVYTLTYKAYNANTGATQANNYIGFTSSSASYYGVTTSFAANTWVEESVNFVLTAETTGNISVGMGAISGGSGSNAKLFVDGVTLTYKSFTDVTEANPVDLTSMVSNTKAAWTGATETPVYDGITMIAVFRGSDWAGDALSQTINGLPAGKYKMEVYCQAHSSWDTDAATEGATGYTYLKANEYSLDVPIRNADGATTKLLHTFEDMTITSGSLKISVVNEKLAANWISIYVKSLTYLGPDLDAAKASLNETLTAANSVDTESPMNSNVKSRLTAAMSAANTALASGTLKQLMDADVELLAAIEAANASIAEYAIIKKYIDKAKKFDEDDDELAALEEKYNAGTLTDAEPVRQALNVWTYNYVSTNFKNEIVLTNWWAVSNAMWSTSGEHWDGSTTTQYYDANGTNTTHTLSKTVELTPGTYVFRGAGRSNTNTTLSLSISIDGIDPVVFNAKGNTGYGIATNGGATFDETAEYARSDQGQGWEWEFIKFTLAEKTEVTLTATCKTDGWGWASFANNGLWMDDATYVVANASALIAPLAAAKALVDTKPMGDAVNTALQNAIALGEDEISTPTQLNAAIEALETAVANANTWVAAYNEAKAPLVAALERFEADYNDAENGALDYMCKSRWATAVEMAQAAAVAKDVTDSYDGFETATNNLVAALDAATVSIDEYSALKTAIDEAGVLYAGDDWGDVPFQKPADRKDDLNAAKTTAQSAYDAAEVDGEGVTAVITSLNTTVNDVVLNAPAEGQRFNIKVATEGHSKYGNALLATLGTTSGNNPTGYSLNVNNALKGHLNQAFIFTQVEGNLYNISIERPEGTVYLTYGSLNGSAAGWATSQIQATTDAANKGQFKVVPTGKNGILKIFNTVANNYLDCQDGGSIYTDTDISSEEFSFVLATEQNVTLNISAAGWATLILPFNAEIPEGVAVYASERVEDDVVKLTEAESIVSNTPYLVNGTAGTYTFSGYGLADKDSYADANDLFVGTYVDYTTVGGEYVLQSHDGKVAFYVVGETTKPKVKAYRCYLNVPASGVKAFFFDFDEATGINGVDAADAEIEAIYTINGTKVNSLQKGLNIFKMSNGKTQKVFVK